MSVLAPASLDVNMDMDGVDYGDDDFDDDGDDGGYDAMTYFEDTPDTNVSLLPFDNVIFLSTGIPLVKCVL